MSIMAAIVSILDCFVFLLQKQIMYLPLKQLMMQEQVIRLASLIALQRHHVSWLLYYIIGIISLIFDFGIVPTVWYFMFFILPWDKNNANFYVMHEETTHLVCVSRHVIKGLAVCVAAASPFVWLVFWLEHFDKHILYFNDIWYIVTSHHYISTCHVKFSNVL